MDADGEPEILFTIYQGKNINTVRLVSVDPYGNIEWFSTESVNMDLLQPPGVPAGTIAVGDLDQDGIGEVLLGDLVINGEDGSLHTTLGEYSNSNWITFMMDLEKDGSHEVVTDFGIFEQDGTQRCDFFFPQGFVAIADINMDGTGEIVLTGNQSVSLYDNYCRLLNYWPTIDGGRAGAATIADYDGDGEGANLIDLQPIVADICEVKCDRGMVKVAIQTGNAGLRDASGQLDVKFYTEVDGVLNEVITVSEEILIRSGTSLGGAQYTFDMTSLPESNLLISVDDNGVEGGVFEECDEDNNQIRIDDLCAEDD